MIYRLLAVVAICFGVLMATPPEAAGQCHDGSCAFEQPAIAAIIARFEHRPVRTWIGHRAIRVARVRPLQAVRFGVFRRQGCTSD